MYSTNSLEVSHTAVDPNHVDVVEQQRLRVMRSLDEVPSLAN